MNRLSRIIVKEHIFPSEGQSVDPCATTVITIIIIHQGKYFRKLLFF